MRSHDELAVFKAIVDEGGISAAARSLNLPKATLWRRLNDLETRLGLPLFHRDLKKIVLTSFGLDCYNQAKRVLRETDRLFAIADRAGAPPEGSLHIICPPLLGAMIIEDLAMEFAASMPRVQLHLEEATTILDPRSVSADLVIYATLAPLPDVTVIARKIASLPYVLAAHPSIFGDAASLPAQPQDLLNHDCLGFGAKSRRWSWTLTHHAEPPRVVQYSPRLTTSHLSALRVAVRQGLGIAALPVALCHRAFREGDLLHVLPDWVPEPASLYAVYPHRRTLSPAAASFLDVIVKRIPDLITRTQAA